jgi:hypothetical protein
MLRLVVWRAALASAAPVLAAIPVLASGGPPAAAKAKSHKPATKNAVRLVTGCEANVGCACHACQQHAANKVFASRADVVRADQGCNCQVRTLAVSPHAPNDALRDRLAPINRRYPIAALLDACRAYIKV